MSYFPSLYQDETLYSGVARYHQRVGGSSHNAIMDLFGISGLGAVTDLPCHLNKLSDRIGGVYTPEGLLMNHTLFPYYASFLSEEISGELRKVMVEGNAKMGKAHATAGLLASMIKHPEKLRYCKICAETDTRLHGEPYWHRVHQLPGVHLCPTHKEPLRFSTVPYTSKTKFVPLSMTILDAPHTLTESDFVNTEHLQRVADQSYTLLNGRSLNVEHIFSSYKVELQNRDLININGGIRFKGILNQFKIFFGSSTLDLLCCVINTKSADTWLHKLVRDPQSVTHPLRHIMMMIFLDVSLKLNQPVRSSPFGESPWPCLNKVAEHYKQNVIFEYTTSYCCLTRKPIATFKCSCGFIYARKGPDIEPADRFRIGKVKDFGSVWRNRLLELTQVEKLSCGLMAQKLGVSSKTIKRHLNLMDNDRTADMREAFLSKKQERRNTLLSLISTMDNKNRTTVRQRLPKEYNWLYRHDKEWLMEQLPLNSLLRLPKSRINWNERDKMLLAKLQDSVINISKQEPPVRVTVTELGRRSGYYSWLAKKVDLLPLCKEYIHENRETSEQFQIRKLEWAKELLLEQEGTIRGWKLLKLAGIPNHYSLIIRDKIVEILKSFDEMYVYKLLFKEEAS